MRKLVGRPAVLNTSDGAEAIPSSSEGDDWIREVKQDGAIGHRSSRTAMAFGSSPNVADWTGVFERAGGRGHCAQNLEGETIKLNAAGLALQKAFGTGKARDIYLVAFDLSHLNGKDLRDRPVEQRREILQGLIPAGNRIQFSEAMPGTGDAVFHLVDIAGVEGMASSERAVATAAGQP